MPVSLCTVSAKVRILGHLRTAEVVTWPFVSESRMVLTDTPGVRFRTAYGTLVGAPTWSPARRPVEDGLRGGDDL